MTTLTLALSVLSGLIAVILTAHLGWRNLISLENEKSRRTRNATGILLQAELAHFHREMTNYNQTLKGYAGQVWNTVGSPAANQCPRIRIGTDRFPVFYSSTSSIGLFSKDTAYNLVYCYFNIFDFEQSQRKFLEDLPDLMNSSNLGQEADGLRHRADALLHQIGNTIDRLAGESQIIPFSRTQF